MNATEYACEFWNNPVPYPHPQFRNGHMQMGYEPLPPTMSNEAQEAAYYHNSHPIYRQNDEYGFAAYNDMVQFKSEGSCRYSADQVPNLVHHAPVNSDCDSLNKTPPLPVDFVPNVKFEHLNETPLRKFPFNRSTSERVGDTLSQCRTENSTLSGNDADDSPALRALLTKPPKERPMYVYGEESKSEAECKQYLSRTNDLKANPNEFLDNCKVTSPTMLKNKDAVSEEQDLQQSHGETCGSYYPWMKTQGNCFSQILP